VTLPVFKTGGWQLRCQWCVRLAHASATLVASSAVRIRDFASRLPVAALRFLGYARDFGNGLRRPLYASTSKPAVGIFDANGAFDSHTLPPYTFAHELGTPVCQH